MRRVLGLLAILLLVTVASGHSQDPAPPRVRFNGDFRVRYEYTTTGNGSLKLGREVVRFRAGITYPVRDDITVRARLATGDPDDPNSTDVTLSSFVNDLTVSLDVASIENTRRRWAAYGGKFFNPLQYTELVWDGDVNPQGVAGKVMLGDATKALATLTGLYFIVDQQVNNLSSDMAGGQLTVAVPAGTKWKASASAAYYDYRIRSLSAAGAGDIRSNRLAPGGAAYLSDFDMLDLILALDYSGLGERYPLRLVGDYVHNSGASDENTGYGVDAYVGRSARKGDLRYRYGYGMTETDAVLAAFSHDNTTLGTNYEIHQLAVDAVPIAGFFLNATLYYYRPHLSTPTRTYQKRLRLNAMVTF
jgi:hypothetical protein